MQIDRPDLGHQRIATLDIETTHWDAEQGEVVSIGVGVHERGDSLTEGEYEHFHRVPARDEPRIIGDAFDWLDESGADYLVSFNGRDFDIPFCRKRLQLRVDDPREPALHDDETHLDLLYDDRKDLADQRGEKWPSLEEVLQTYGFEPEPTFWDGQPLTNTRFGEELGPAYLQAINRGDQVTAEELADVIDDYLREDLLHNLRIYYHDIGEF